jgi:hypothetical protein
VKHGGCWDWNAANTANINAAHFRRVSEPLSPEPLLFGDRANHRFPAAGANGATEAVISVSLEALLRFCDRWLPELNLVPIEIIDPGEATVGLIHPFGVNLYSL